MNAMTLAFKASGVPVPSLKTRIWTLIKDSPDQSYAQVATRLGEPGKNVSSLLGTLVNEGRATNTPTFDKRTGRNVARYSAVVEKDGSMPPKRNGKRAVKPSPPPPQQPQAAKPAPVPQQPQRIDVATLPLAEAKRVYEELRTFFGGVYG